MKLLVLIARGTGWLHGRCLKEWHALYGIEWSEWELQRFVDRIRGERE